MMITILKMPYEGNHRRRYANPVIVFKTVIHAEFTKCLSEGCTQRFYAKIGQRLEDIPHKDRVCPFCRYRQEHETAIREKQEVMVKTILRGMLQRNNDLDEQSTNEHLKKFFELQSLRDLFNDYYAKDRSERPISLYEVLDIGVLFEKFCCKKGLTYGA